MNNDVKERWIAALESGDYQKGKSALKCADKYCCLGVLAEIEKVPRKASANNPYDDYVFEDGYISASYPSLIFLNSIGLTPYHTDHLAALNDTTSTFSEVIEYIKTEIE